MTAGAEGATTTEREIDQLVVAFFGQFDNRDDRSPKGAALNSLFDPQATIIKMTPEGPDVMTVTQFIEPRITSRWRSLVRLP